MSDLDIAKEWYLGSPVATAYDTIQYVPTCPNCHEVSYWGMCDDNRCPFCRQLLKEPEKGE